MYDYSENKNDTLVYTDLTNSTHTNLKTNFQNETKTSYSYKNTKNTVELKLPIANSQVNEPADEQFDASLIFELNNNMCLQPASEFDNFNCLNTDTDKALYD